jgi:hypothetical protein
MTKTNGLLNINKLENLEFSMTPWQFSIFIHFFIFEVENNIKDVEKSAKSGDFDKVINLTDFLRTKILEVGTPRLNAKITRVQSACRKKQKSETLKSVGDAIKTAEQTLDAMREVLLIAFNLHQLRN